MNLRSLNAEELEIIETKEQRKKIKIKLPTAVDYKELIPRTTLCILVYDIYEPIRYVIAIRSSRDKDIPEVGQKIAFSRAIDSTIK